MRSPARNSYTEGGNDKKNIKAAKEEERVKRAGGEKIDTERGKYKEEEHNNTSDSDTAGGQRCG